MSATDSDNSIDWLASDNEDDDSDREPERAGKRPRAEAPPSPAALLHLGNVNRLEGDWSEVREAPGQGSPGRRAEARGWNAAGLCKSQPGETAGKRPHQAQKRHCGSAGEDRGERQLISGASEKDLVFTRKCLELQCYIHPLSSILNGLRSGRYRERLSSFQESVAMDRIQRIMGVLQNPCMGEKYINIIQKMEEMLKSWFPNVKLHDQPAVARAEEAVPSKKAKLSPVTMTAAVSPVTVSEVPLGAKALRVTDLTPPGAYSASNLKWLHTSPICSPTAAPAPAGLRHPPSPRDRDLTQDNAVSSSTDGHAKTDSVPRGPPPPGKINAPCLERLLKSTESIITRKGMAGLMDSSWS